MENPPQGGLNSRGLTFLLPRNPEVGHWKYQGWPSGPLILPRTQVPFFRMPCCVCSVSNFWSQDGDSPLSTHVCSTYKAPKQARDGPCVLVSPFLFGSGGGGGIFPEAPETGKVWSGTSRLLCGKGRLP